MRRREFIALVGGATVALPSMAGAQQGERVRRIGVLMGFAESDPTAQSWVAAFRDALAKLGWSEGNNLRVELRWGAAEPDRIRTLAKELVDLRPDAIFDQTTPNKALASPAVDIARATKHVDLESTVGPPFPPRRPRQADLVATCRWGLTSSPNLERYGQFKTSRSHIDGGPSL